MMNTAIHSLTYRVSTAAAKLDISRATIYRLAAAGKLRLIKVSTRASGITAESLNKYVNDCGK
jgi:excisionase family DNA binding protein